MKEIYETIEFEPESFKIFQEIVSRWGQSDYDDEAKRKEHQDALKLEWETYEYARKREAEFPSITDVTIALAEKMEGQPHFWNEITALRLEVKSKYPKP